MKEKTLVKIALVCSLTGVLLLLVVAEHQEIEVSSIADIVGEKMNTLVKIRGEITAITKTPATTIMQVKDDTGEITVIMFQEESTMLAEENAVEVEGIAKKEKNHGNIEAKHVTLL